MPSLPGWLHALERLRPHRLGLRKRITLAYSLGALKSLYGLTLTLTLLLALLWKLRPQA